MPTRSVVSPEPHSSTGPDVSARFLSNPSRYSQPADQSFPQAPTSRSSNSRGIAAAGDNLLYSRSATENFAARSRFSTARLTDPGTIFRIIFRSITIVGDLSLDISVQQPICSLRERTHERGLGADRI